MHGGSITKNREKMLPKTFMKNILAALLLTGTSLCGMEQTNNDQHDENISQLLFTAIRQSNLEDFDRAIEKLASRNIPLSSQVTSDGNTLLHVAFLGSGTDKKIVDYLLHEDIDQNAVNHAGETPLDVVCTNGNCSEAAMNYLREFGLKKSEELIPQKPLQSTSPATSPPNEPNLINTEEAIPQKTSTPTQKFVPRRRSLLNPITGTLIVAGGVVSALLIARIYRTHFSE